MPKVDKFGSFLEPAVQEVVVNKYGKDHVIKGDRILKTFKTYPYPKDVGYWFVKDNDLFVVMNDN